MSVEGDLDVSPNFRAQSLELWNDAIEKFTSKKSKTCLKTREEVKEIIEILREAKNGKAKERRHYYLLANYRYEIDDLDTYILYNMQGYRIPIKEELFALLFRVHKEKSHGRIDLMYNAKALKPYVGITKELIVIFLSCCQSCILKINKVKIGLIVKSILSTNFNDICQMDLIDLQSKPDGEFKFILIYQDQFTKYCLLRLLKFKNAESVVAQLKSIISNFGPCSELQTDNGLEFANSTIESLIKEYGGKLIHGIGRQGSIKRASRDIQNILSILKEAVVLIQFRNTRVFNIRDFQENCMS